jgi:predicted signal transduction protein with EAL and GGDEF domain
MVLAEFVRPFELSVGNVVISASIGVAKTSGPAAALELIRDADTAMYKAKGSGRNAYALFDTSLRDRVRDRMNLEQALRSALGQGELPVHFRRSWTWPAASSTGSRRRCAGTTPSWARGRRSTSSRWPRRPG